MTTYFADQTLDIFHVAALSFFFLLSTVFWYRYGAKMALSRFFDVAICWITTRRHDGFTQAYFGALGKILTATITRMASEFDMKARLFLSKQVTSLIKRE